MPYSIDVKLGKPLFDDYLTRLRLKGTGVKGCHNFIRAAEPFLTYCREHEIDPLQIDALGMHAYFAQAGNGKPYAEGTKRLHYVQLRAAYQYGRDRGFEGLPPVAWYLDFKQKGKADSIPETIPSEEIVRTLRDCPSERHHVLLTILTFTGMRLDEVRRARWEDIDWTTRCIRVIGKGGKPRLVPLHPRVQEVLADFADSEGHVGSERSGAIIYTAASYLHGLPPGGHFESASAFGRFLKLATDRGFHAFRKTVGSSLAANEVQESIIFAILGWAPRTVFAKHYLNVSPAMLHRAISKLYLDQPLDQALPLAA
jgi:integrase